ncbi:MAG TPA: peptidoglycan-binding domain-containing protein [Candidatus Paceibacterota bacterium]|nr:peptidoglycan-binding domain-containing protein [Candidatus Paceibacterota bacterium]
MRPRVSLLPVVPVIPAPTVAASAFSFLRNLGIGSTGADVSELQKRLAAAGHFSGPVTGYFGPMTEAAVRAFQGTSGVPATGYVGQLTLGKLNGMGASVAASTADHSAEIVSLQQQLVGLLQELAVMLKK